MMTIISGTDRPESNSYKVAQNYAKEALNQGVEVCELDLEDLPFDFFAKSTYGNPNNSFSQVLEKKIIPASHIVFVVPEYNGSFPGILKLFIDTTDPRIWKGKKAALVGLATGRSGNIRGLDHLTMVLHYLQTEVYSFKTFFSSIHLHLDEQGAIVNKEYKGLIKTQIEGFLKF